MSFCYKYPRPAITVDAVVFAEKLEPMVLLIQRKNPPFQGQWAFPGGFVDMSETVEEAVKRELFEETNLLVENLQQFKTYSRVDRDPRGRAISVVFTARLEKVAEVIAQDDAMNVCWFPIKELPSLAFDHNEILEEVLGAFAV
ncbi:MAG: NUDIX hydrolase [Flavobacteriaceae bacterium]|nr:NUDIX hydrolase [Flavobacteriaceae bacterium]